MAVVDNPYLPLTPGTVYHSRSETPDGVETNDVAVTRDSKTILGVRITAVHDQVFLEGDLTEDTFDWFGQDADGNIWYFGEDSKEIENGQVVSTEGSWQAGQGDNQPGIIMLAHPKVGLLVYQSLLTGRISRSKESSVRFDRRWTTPSRFFSSSAAASPGCCSFRSGCRVSG